LHVRACAIIELLKKETSKFIPP